MPIHQLRRYLHRAVAATALAALLPMAGCRKEIPMIRSEAEYVTSPTSPERIEGFFLVNEGNMGSNKCTIDHFNARTGGYQRNIYPERNPDVVKELGDVGNDIAIHKDRLYVVVNCSNLVEVMDVHTAEHIGSISIPNCRYIVFEGDRAYVSSYAGPVQIDPEARPGKVVEIDTESLTITREVVVGYQPEEMVITGGRLYVANSGDTASRTTTARCRWWTSNRWRSSIRSMWQSTSTAWRWTATAASTSARAAITTARDRTST